MVTIPKLSRAALALGLTVILAGCATQPRPVPDASSAVAPHEPAPPVEAEDVRTVVVYVPYPYHRYHSPFYRHYDPFRRYAPFGVGLLNDWSYDFYRRAHRKNRRRKNRSD